MNICIIDRAKDSRVNHADLVAIAQSIAVQVAVDFCGWWERAPINMLVADAAPAGYDQFLVTALMDAPDAVAYHSLLSNGRPLLRVGLDAVDKNGGNFMDELSKAMSHEVLETLADPYAGMWSDFPGNKKVALEICDPVQGDFYRINGVAVSNFVGPRWFRSGAGPFDKMGQLTKPFTISPGGYLEFSDGNFVFGDRVAEWRMGHVHAHGRRIRARIPTE